ncbi:energy transducer TonB [Dyella silvae]|uniref:energy transducer TonB n=1 Tax=Dyella silvae TaxID=2994424 RepID=UPI002264BF6E|nr:energy transducer TonB [Dyella silvae]
MSPVSSRRRTQGVARYGLLIVATLMVAGAAVIYWKIIGRDEGATATTGVVAATGPVIREGADTAELLQHAREAMSDGRLLAPSGNNAFEFYLAVLKREPGNQVAQDALREIFPFAAHAAEQSIDAGDEAESQREIELLTRADPKNYTLTLLQAKLEDQRAVAQQNAKREQQASPSTNRAPVAVSAPAPVAPTTAVVTPPTPAPAPAPVVAKPAVALTPAEHALAQLHVESTPVEAAPRAAVRPRAVAAATADSNGAVAPTLTRRVEPAYPPDARRTRRQGWVDVTFTVLPDGTVSGANVADADPRYVFDRAALTAVTRWQFTPGMQDGKPVASPMRQRIEFRL